MRIFPSKQCAKYGIVKPRTDAYFDRKASRVDSFKRNCKECDTKPLSGMSVTTRWKNDLYIVGNTICGTIYRDSSSAWRAYGCMDEWEDTRIGTYTTVYQARLAVQLWVKDAVIAKSGRP